MSSSRNHLATSTNWQCGDTLIKASTPEKKEKKIYEEKLVPQPSPQAQAVSPSGKLAGVLPGLALFGQPAAG